MTPTLTRRKLIIMASTVDIHLTLQERISAEAFLLGVTDQHSPYRSKYAKFAYKLGVVAYTEMSQYIAPENRLPILRKREKIPPVLDRRHEELDQ